MRNPTLRRAEHPAGMTSPSEKDTFTWVDCHQDEATETKDEAYLGLQGKQSRGYRDTPDQQEEFDQDFHHDRKSNARIMSPFVFRSVPQSRPAWVMVDFLNKAVPPGDFSVVAVASVGWAERTIKSGGCPPLCAPTLGRPGARYHRPVQA